MNKSLIITTLLLSTPGLLIPGGRNSKPEEPRKPRGIGAVATGNVLETAQTFDKTVDKIDKIISGERAKEVVSGAVVGLFGGAATVAKAGAVGGLEIVKDGAILGAAGAKAAAITVATSPLTLPIVAGAAVTGGAGYIGYMGWVCHRENQYNRCLSKHFFNANVNEHGYPKRCDSPERRLRYWDKGVADTYRERFTAMKKRGLRPEGEYLGHSGVEDEEIRQ